MRATRHIKNKHRDNTIASLVKEINEIKRNVGLLLYINREAIDAITQNNLQAMAAVSDMEAAIKEDQGVQEEEITTPLPSVTSENPEILTQS